MDVVARGDAIGRCQGELPRVIRLAAASQDAPEWIAKRVEEIESEIDRHGAVLVRGLTLADPADFAQVVRRGWGELLEYDDRVTPRSKVVGKVYSSTNASPHYTIQMHCEHAYAASWPRRLFFYCQVAAESGGATPLADVGRVYARLTRDLRERFERHGVMYRRSYGNGPGMSWREALGVDTREQAEAWCRSAGVSSQWIDAQRLRTSVVRPAAVRHPRTGEAMWFNHAMTLHASSLDAELRRILLRQADEADLPHHTCYGDGSPIDDATIETVRQAYRAETHRFDWRPGDLLILDNMRIAHGRDPYKSERRIVAAMAQEMCWSETTVIGGGLAPVATPTDGEEAFDVMLYRICREILKLDRVDPAVSFLHHGGDSALAARVITRLEHHTGREASLRAFFEAPTLAALAEQLQR